MSHWIKIAIFLALSHSHALAEHDGTKTPPIRFTGLEGADDRIVVIYSRTDMHPRRRVWLVFKRDSDRDGKLVVIAHEGKVRLGEYVCSADDDVALDRMIDYHFEDPQNPGSGKGPQGFEFRSIVGGETVHHSVFRDHREPAGPEYLTIPTILTFMKHGTLPEYPPEWHER